MEHPENIKPAALKNIAERRLSAGLPCTTAILTLNHKK
jgi:hypothetical protein